MSLYWSCVGNLERIIGMISVVSIRFTSSPFPNTRYLMRTWDSYLKVGASIDFISETSLICFLYEARNWWRFQYCYCRNVIVLGYLYSEVSLMKFLIITQAFQIVYVINLNNILCGFSILFSTDFLKIFEIFQFELVLDWCPQQFWSIITLNVMIGWKLHCCCCFLSSMRYLYICLYKHTAAYLSLSRFIFLLILQPVFFFFFPKGTSCIVCISRLMKPFFCSYVSLSLGKPIIFINVWLLILHLDMNHLIKHLMCDYLRITITSRSQSLHTHSESNLILTWFLFLQYLSIILMQLIFSASYFTWATA